MILTTSAKMIYEAIKRAIETSRITNNEYQQILETAMADNVIDNHERALLREFRNLIMDGTIKRVS